MSEALARKSAHYITVEHLPSANTLQWSRKFFHTFAGLTFLYLFVYSGLPETVVWSVTGIAVTFMFTVEFIRHKNQKFNSWLCKRLTWVMRERERHSINSSIYYAISMLLVYFLFPLEVAILTLLCLAVGDSAASIVGVYWGKRQIVGLRGSVEGFVACGVTCALLALFCAGTLFQNNLSGWPLISFAFSCGVIGAAAEGSLPQFDDNLIMPLVSAPAFLGMMKLFGII